MSKYGIFSSILSYIDIYNYRLFFPFHMLYLKKKTKNGEFWKGGYDERVVMEAVRVKWIEIACSCRVNLWCWGSGLTHPLDFSYIL